MVGSSMGGETITIFPSGFATSTGAIYRCGNLFNVVARAKVTCNDSVARAQRRSVAPSTYF
jgi:hypothetical protein